jgi:hypothetical protein
MATLYVVKTMETKRCGKEERTEPSGWGSGDRLLMQSPPKFDGLMFDGLPPCENA